MRDSTEARYGLSEASLRQMAPAVFTESHPMSSRYQQVRTYDMVQAFEQIGYFPVKAQQHNPLKRDPRYVTHMVTLRHADVIERGAKVGEQCPQIIVLNSHNGRRRLTLMAGIYRFVCANGLIIGESQFRFAASHLGDVHEKAAAFAAQLNEELPRINYAIASWSNIELPKARQLELARIAMALRWSKDAPYEPSALLQPRRGDDAGDSLWHVFNRVQENCMKGGIEGTNANGRKVTSRELTQIDQNAEFNSALWGAAETFATAA
jgi:hypothetical protein